MTEIRDQSIPTVPLIETFRGALKFVKNPLPVINEALKRYGSTYITRIIGGQRLIMSIDPEIVKHVLQTNHKNYIKSKIQTESLGQYVGQGLLTVNGPYWLKQRRLIQPGFHKSRLEGLVSIVVDETEDFISDLGKSLDTNGAKNDLGGLMSELTLRIVSKALFSSGIVKDEIKDLGVKLILQQEHIIREIRQPQWNWIRKLTGKKRKALLRSQEIRDGLHIIIKERQANINGGHDDLLQMLLEARYEDTGEGMSVEQLIDEVLILFVAGHETTANTLTWCLYLLTQHPEIYKEAKKEASRLVSNGWDLGKVIKNDMLQQIVSETMRLYPPAWILDRMALEDDHINGAEIRKGDLIGLYTYGAHRNPEYWEHPDKFIPARFSPESKHDDPPKYAYFPFGGGPRFCIGSQFALMEMKIALAGILDQFDFKMISEHVQAQPLITLRPKEPIIVHVD
ncbi:MAG: cytochrome P450 [Saprospiraceae bacterium]|jgi:cytochrome P450